MRWFARVPSTINQPRIPWCRGFPDAGRWTTMLSGTHLAATALLLVATSTLAATVVREAVFFEVWVPKSTCDQP